MPWDSNGDWYDTEPPTDDFREFRQGSGPDVVIWVILLLLMISLGVGGWYVSRYINYELFYKDMVEAEVEKRLKESN